MTDAMIEEAQGATKQPTRGRVREERQFDKTQLKESHHGRLVHRDYAAHFFRWAWVARQFKAGDAVLDVGCGQDQQLALILTQRPGTVRETYVGVDLNRIDKKRMFSWATIRDEFDFTTRYGELLIGGTEEPRPGQVEAFERIVCLEVIEHMGVDDGKALLAAFQEVISTTGVLYLSTPVFNGYAAANHIHEYTIPELAQALDDAGFEVERRVGTFASLPEVRHVLDDVERKMVERLSWWFSNEVLSVMLAPNHPDQSRNNLWVCRPRVVAK